MSGMNRFDMEFWNGALKGVLGAEQELRDAGGKTGSSAAEGMRLALSTLRDYRRRMERLHAQGIREFLEQFRE